MKRQSDYFVEILVAMFLILTVVKIETERTELEAKHKPANFQIEEQFLPPVCGITQVERELHRSVKSSVDL